MQRKPVLPIQIMAVLNMVVGVIGTAALIMQLPAVQRFLGGRSEDRNGMFEFIAQRQPSVVAYQQVNYWVGIVATLAFIAAGVGLMVMWRWARAATLTLAVIDFLRRGADVLYGLLVVYPAIQAYSGAESAVARSTAARSAAAAIETGFLIRVAFAAIFIIYPVVLLSVMLRSDVAAAFREVADEDESD